MKWAVEFMKLQMLEPQDVENYEHFELLGLHFAFFKLTNFLIAYTYIGAGNML